MNTLLSDGEGFFVLPRKPNSKHKHDIVVLGNNKYYFSKQYKQNVYYQCSSKGCKFGITLQHDLKRISFPGRCGYNAFVQNLAERAHEPAHPDTWSAKKQLYEWASRHIVQLCQSIKPRAAWQQFSRMFPIESRCFTKYGQIKSILYERQSRVSVSLPATRSEAVAAMKDTKNACCWNFWGRQRLQSETSCSDDTVVDLVVLNEANLLHRELKKSQDIIRRHQKRSRFIHSRLLQISAPEYYHSTFLWNSDDDGKIIIFGSHHGGLRLLAPVSTIFSNGQLNLCNMRDGTFITPQLKPTSKERHPWVQVQQIGVVVQAPDQLHKSKYFGCMWALLPDKSADTYSRLNELIEAGYQKRGAPDTWRKQSASIVQQCQSLCAASNDSNTFHDAKQMEIDSDHNDDASASSSHAKSAELQYQIFCPDAIAVDFEQGPINTIQDSYGGVGINGCFFHFYQANVRKLGKLHMRVPYMADHTFRCEITKIVLCAFLPIDQVCQVIDGQMRSLSQCAPRGRKLAVQQFIVYFRNTWLRLYPPSIWNVFLRVDRTSDLLERDNREFKDVMGVAPFLWEYVRQLVHIDADTTQDYHRLLEHGSAVFDPKKPKQRERDQELADKMLQYSVSDRSDPQKYLLEIAAIYAKRTVDQQLLLAALDEHESRPPPDAEEITVPQPGVHYIADAVSLQTMRADVSNANACDAAWLYIQTCMDWRQKTSGKNTLKKDVHRTAQRYNGTVSNLLNAIVGIKFGSYWYAEFVGFVEDGSALIFGNDKKAKYQIVMDLQRSIEEQHVILL